MSIALGDVNAESLKALVSQGGAELDEFVDRVQKAAGATGSDLLAQLSDELSEVVNNLEATAKDLFMPVTQSAPQLVALLTEIKERGLVINISLASK